MKEWDEEDDQGTEDGEEGSSEEDEELMDLLYGRVAPANSGETAGERATLAVSNELAREDELATSLEDPMAWCDVRALKLQFLRHLSGSLVADLKSTDRGGALALVQYVEQLAPVDPEFVLKAALYTRMVLTVRSSAIVVLAAAADQPACAPYVRRYGGAIMRLPSDWVDAACAYFRLPQRRLKGQGLPGCLRKAMVERFAQFDEYQLGKYNNSNKIKRAKKKEKELLKEAGSGATAGPQAVARGKPKWGKDLKRAAEHQKRVEEAVKRAAQKPTKGEPRSTHSIKHLVRLLHISRPTLLVMKVLGCRYPKDAVAYARSGLTGVFEERLAGTRMKLAVPETWETQISREGNTAAVWESLVSHQKLPFMAMLRNLRNLLCTGVQDFVHRHVLRSLQNEQVIAASMQFPFRFFSAYDALDFSAAPSPTTKHGNSTAAKTKPSPAAIKKKPAREDMVAKYRQALDVAVRLATKHNVRSMPGRTLILLAEGSAMAAPLSGPAPSSPASPSSMRTTHEVAILMALMAWYSCEDCRLLRLTQAAVDGQEKLEEARVDAQAPLLAQVRQWAQQRPLGPLRPSPSFPRTFLADLTAAQEHYDAILVFGTEAYLANPPVVEALARYRSEVHPAMLFACVQVTGRASVGASSRSRSDRDLALVGFSDAVLKYIAECGDENQLAAVETVDRRFSLPELTRPPASPLPWNGLDDEDERNEDDSVFSKKKKINKTRSKKPSPPLYANPFLRTTQKKSALKPTSSDPSSTAWPLRETLLPSLSQLSASVGNSTTPFHPADAAAEEPTPLDDEEAFRVSWQRAHVQEQQERAVQHRVVRVFVSSTFVDMHGERDVLTSRVFPELRDRCRRRGLRFEEVDLRWGVSSSSGPDDVRAVRTCLEEVDRCRPFLVGMVGLRRGWCPAHYLPPNAAISRPLAWLAREPAGRSLTELELEFGALRFPDLVHAVVGVRDETYVSTRFPASLDREPERALWASPHPEDHDAMQRLRRRVLHTLPASFLYRPTGPIAPSPQGGPLQAHGLDAFATEMVERLWKGVEERFPPLPAWNGGIEEECMQMERQQSELVHRHVSKPLLGRQAERQALERGLLDRHVAASPIFLVTGEPGVGKSALVAQVEQSVADRALVLSHRIRPGRAADVSRILQRWERAVRACHAQAPERPSDVPLSSWLEQWLPPLALRRPMIFLLDGLEQLTLNDQRLAWLPLIRNAKYLLVMTTPTKNNNHSTTNPSTHYSFSSSSLESNSLELNFLESDGLEKSLNQRFVRGGFWIPEGGIQKIRVHALDRASAGQLVQRELARYGKRLEDGPGNVQMRPLLAKRDGRRPAYLSRVCELLRREGSSDAVSRRIRELPHDWSTLRTQRVSAVLDLDEGAQSVVRVLLEAVAAADAWGGLAEAEAQAVCERVLGRSVPRGPWSSAVSLAMPLLDAERRDAEGLLALEAPDLRPFIAMAPLEGKEATVQRLWRALADELLRRPLDARGLRVVGEAAARDAESKRRLASELGQVPTLQQLVNASLGSATAEAIAVAVAGPGEDGGLRPLGRFLSLHADLFKHFPFLFLQQWMLSPPFSSSSSLYQGWMFQPHSSLGESFLFEEQEQKQNQNEQNQEDSEEDSNWMEMEDGVWYGEGGRMEAREEVTALASRVDGEEVAVACRDGGVRLVRVRDGAEQGRLEGHSNWVVSVAYARQGERLATAAWDHSVRVWERATLGCTLRYEHAKRASAVALSESGRLVASGGWDCTVLLHSVEENRVLARLRGHARPIAAVVFAPKAEQVGLSFGSHDVARRLLLSASWDGDVRVWDLDSLDCILCLQPAGPLPGSSPQSLVISDDGTRWALATFSGHLHLWDARDCWPLFASTNPSSVEEGGSRISTVKSSPYWKAHEATIRGVQFVGAEGRVLASAAADRTVRLWDVVGGRRLGDRHRWVEADEEGCSAAVLCGGTALLGIRGGGELRAVALTASSERRVLQRIPDAHPRALVHVACAGSHLVTLCEAGFVGLWRMQSGRATLVRMGPSPFPALPRRVLLLESSDESCTLAVGCTDGSVHVCTASASEFTVVRSLRAHSAEITALAWARARLLSASLDGSVHIYRGARLETLEPVRRLTGPADGLLALAVSRDLRRVVAGGWDQRVWVWDGRSGACLGAPWTGPAGAAVTALHLAESYAASAYADGSVALWGLESGRLASFSSRAHSQPVLLLTEGDPSSSDPSPLWSVSLDGTARMWQPMPGGLRGLLRGHGLPVDALARGPLGSLVSATATQVQVWEPRRGSSDLARTLAQRHAQPVVSLLWTEDALLSLSRDGGLLRWTGEASAEPLLSSPLKDHGVALFSSSTRKVGILHGSRSMSWLELEGARAHVYMVEEVCVHPVSAVAAVGSSTVVGSWMGELAWNGQPPSLLPAAVSCMAPFGVDRALVGLDNGAVMLADSRTAKESLAFSLNARIRAVTGLHESSKCLAVDAAEVRLWDIAQGAMLSSTNSSAWPLDAPLSAAVSLQALQLAAFGSTSGDLVLWDPRTPLQTVARAAVFSPIVSLAVPSSNRPFLALGDLAGHVRVFDVRKF